MGVAVSEDGGEQGSMGVALGDYDNSGRLQHLRDQLRRGVQRPLPRRRRPLHATCRSARRPRRAACPTSAGARPSSTTTTTACSTSSPSTATSIRSSTRRARGASAGYRQRKLLYHNRGDGTFDEVAAQYGPVLHGRAREPRAGHGRPGRRRPGRPDRVNDLDGSPQVLRNEAADVGNWLLVKLVGKGKNTDAIGAVVTVRAGRLTQTRNVRSGTSYLSQDDMRQHFGLGRGGAGGLGRGAVAGRQGHQARGREGEPGARGTSRAVDGLRLRSSWPTSSPREPDPSR